MHITITKRIKASYGVFATRYMASAEAEEGTITSIECMTVREAIGELVLRHPGKFDVSLSTEERRG